MHAPDVHVHITDNSCTHIETCTRTHTHSHMYTYTHTHTQTHTHKHKHMHTGNSGFVAYAQAIYKVQK